MIEPAGMKQNQVKKNARLEIKLKYLVQSQFEQQGGHQHPKAPPI